MEEKKIIVFPLFFRSDDNAVHIKMLDASTMVYVRTLKKDNFFDYCLYRTKLTPERLESTQKLYLPATEEQYNSALQNLFSTMAFFSDKLKEANSQDEDHARLSA
ncbi:hypothetical protein [Xanthocytophaga agilis]|uniref:Uncharacterized protein n=1 Tax=Xanthocytophaga agilis TaxID=3048010 RepID=A0AAE3QYQ2_9BACT|nr:hypothetical protein [Xanthocytophaga agilis]MDJ1500489.1 hypothetical protein [Xanthocytophaga agilis]